MYNGQWIRVDDARAPLVMNGWSFESTGVHYDGIAVNGNQRLEACGCRDAALNGILARPSLQVTASIGKPERTKNRNTSSPVIIANNSEAAPAAIPASSSANNSAAAAAPKPSGSNATILK